MNNQQILLNTILEQNNAELDESLKIDDFFNLFVTEQVLKNYELSYDEILEGIVDSGGDGGIDSIYIFVNMELAQRDTDLIDGKRNSIIDVFLIQSKNTNGFGETPIEKCVSSANDLFDFTKDIDSLRTVYNNNLLAIIDTFRKQFLHLASKFPILKFHYFYASKGMEVHANVSRKVENLKEIIAKHFDKAELSFEFLTANKLIELSRRERIKTKGLKLLDNPISTKDGGYIAIAPLKNYFDFLVDEDNQLIRYFFDSNIRDYQGKVEVNTEIKATLQSTESVEDFWWLNNGVTITATNASVSSKILQIEDPQIVNGLQTSFEIYNFFKEFPDSSDERNILIRVVKTDDEKSRLKVIKATNSQTNVPPSSLRATDLIHRDIEDYLLSKGFYYDRRKNYHKNQGRPINKIISISYLAQIVMAVIERKPDYARARPSTLIKNNQDYQKIFGGNLPIDLYFKLIVIQKFIEQCLRTYSEPKLSRAQIGDIKFHITMYLVCRLTNKLNPEDEAIANINTEDLDSDLTKEAIQNTFIIYDSMGGNNSVAKGKEFVTEVLNQIEEDLNEA